MGGEFIFLSSWSFVHAPPRLCGSLHDEAPSYVANMCGKKFRQVFLFTFLSCFIFRWTLHIIITNCILGSVGVYALQRSYDIMIMSYEKHRRKTVIAEFFFIIIR